MTLLRRLLFRLFRRKTDWDALDYGTPAAADDELASLNGEQL